MSDIIARLKAGELTPEQAIKATESHGDYVGDIAIDLDRQSLRCGFPTIEEHEYILSNRGNLVVIAGRAGNGKSAMASQIALNASLHTKVLYFSLEMSKAALTERILSVVSGVPIKKLKNPAFASKVKNGYVELKKHKLKLIDTPKLGKQQILSMIYDENTIEKVGLVVIDYLGLVSQDKSDRRHLDISDIASTFKTQVADRLSIPVLGLAQMNQMIDQRLAESASLKAKGKELEIRPMLSDMGESKGIADSADVVMFIRRPCLTDPEIERNLFKVAVCKNRNGTTQDFDLDFSEELTKFFDKGII